MAVNGYAFNYTDVTDPSVPIPNQFVLGGISQDVAKGIRYGLRQVPTITNVTVQQIVETRSDVT